MARVAGSCREINVEGEAACAFILSPLPAEKPLLRIAGMLAERHAEAVAALSRMANPKE